MRVTELGERQLVETPGRLPVKTRSRPLDRSLGSVEIWTGNISLGRLSYVRFPGKQIPKWTFGASCAVSWGVLLSQHLLGVRRLLLRKEMSRSGPGRSLAVLLWDKGTIFNIPYSDCQ